MTRRLWDVLRTISYLMYIATCAPYFQCLDLLSFLCDYSRLFLAHSAFLATIATELRTTAATHVHVHVSYMCMRPLRNLYSSFFSSSFLEAIYSFFSSSFLEAIAERTTIPYHNNRSSYHNVRSKRHTPRLNWCLTLVDVLGFLWCGFGGCVVIVPASSAFSSPVCSSSFSQFL